MKPFVIEAKNIHKTFSGVEVIRNIDFSVCGGDVVCIKGESGAGKTTFLQILGTLQPIDNTDGCLKINDTEVQLLGQKELARFRNTHIGFVFQFHHLLPEFTALENIMIPALIKKTSKKEAQKKAYEYIQFLGIKDIIDKKPGYLSGGEQQRVAMARALINAPSIILADEPTGNLDSKNADLLHELILKLRQNFGQTFVIVTHNNELSDLADQTYIIKDGVFV